MTRPLALTLALGCLLGSAALAADQPFIGTAAPPFDLPALGGGNVDLAGLSGKTVVLHFGAGW